MKLQMNSFVLFISLFVSLVQLTSCAFGPLQNHETARTVGEGNAEFSAGALSFFVPVIKYNYGLSDRWDLGFHFETFSYGFRTKYAMLQDTGSLDLAAVFMVGESGSEQGSSFPYVHGELIGSRRVSKVFEPYATLAYSAGQRIGGRQDEPTNDSLERFISDALRAPDRFDYFSIRLGSRLWFSEKGFVSAEFAQIYVVGSDVSGWVPQIIPSVAVGGQF